MIRPEVLEFTLLGKLPDSSSPESVIEKCEQALAGIHPPISIEEGQLLVNCFGTDDCFGMAWTLLHLIESSATPVVSVDPGDLANDWVKLLWNRLVNRG